MNLETMASVEKPQLKIQSVSQTRKCLNQSFLSQSLKRHVTFNPQNRPRDYQKYVKKYCECRICGKVFLCPSSLKNHKKIHSREKPYKRLHCEKAFSYRFCAERHMLTHSADRHKCKLCGEIFPNADTLRGHRIIHSGEMPECKDCGRMFWTSSSLDLHKRLHTTEKLYECKHCRKTFKNYCSFRLHKWIHTGEKPYECKQCGKTFSCSRKIHNSI